MAYYGRSLELSCGVVHEEMDEQQAGSLHVERLLNMTLTESSAVFMRLAVAWIHAPIGRNPPWNKNIVSLIVNGSPLKSPNTVRDTLGE